MEKIYAISEEMPYDAPMYEQPFFYKLEDAQKRILIRVEEDNSRLSDNPKRERWKATSKHDPYFFQNQTSKLSIEEFEII